MLVYNFMFAWQTILIIYTVEALIQWFVKYASIYDVNVAIDVAIEINLIFRYLNMFLQGTLLRLKKN